MTILETPSRIEPCMLDEYPAALGDLISDVVALSAELGGSSEP